MIKWCSGVFFFFWFICCLHNHIYVFFFLFKSVFLRYAISLTFSSPLIVPKKLRPSDILSVASLFLVGYKYSDLKKGCKDKSLVTNKSTTERRGEKKNKREKKIILVSFVRVPISTALIFHMENEAILINFF